MNLFSRKKEIIGSVNLDSFYYEDEVVGKDLHENVVFRCKKTKLLYILGKPTKKYISVKDVKLNSEENNLT